MRAKLQKIELQWRADENVPEKFVSDSHRIRQILLNFLSNALKFTLRGSIELSCEVVRKGVLRFSVRDSGIGMSAAKKASIFMPFNKDDSKNRRQFNQ
jgi:signal transduction histidine kinase